MLKLNIYQTDVGQKWGKDFTKNILKNLADLGIYNFDRYRRWVDFQMAAASKLITYNALASKMGCSMAEVVGQLKLTNYGKPYLPDYGGFNYSHSDGAVIVAIADCVDVVQIGIDIERVKPYPADLVPEVLDFDEIQLLNKSNDKDRLFFKFWTFKEAILKAKGVGLSVSPKVISSNLSHNNPVQIQWDVKQLPTCNDYVAHVASSMNFDFDYRILDFRLNTYTP